jgi:hypothetical protein
MTFQIAFQRIIKTTLWLLNNHSSNTLTSKGRRPFFGPFLDIGQGIVDEIFV